MPDPQTTCPGLPGYVVAGAGPESGQVNPSQISLLPVTSSST